MQLFRNREIRRQIVISCCITLAAAVLSAVFFGFGPAVFVLCCGAAVTGIDIYYLFRRYRRISELSDDIDRVLHGQDSLAISGSEEGELAVLRSEIGKMTVRLREQADSLKADKAVLSDAIADMFHQMRTPVTSMTLQLRLLESEDLSYEKRVELTRELKKQVEKIHWLTETLLKISRLDAGTVELKSEPVRVKDLASKAASPFAIPMELLGIDLITEIEDESFEGDISWSAEALGNLIKNCMEHSAHGGWVRIRAEETALFTQITVQDNGDGFCAEDIPHLFDRFYKGRNSSESSIGIGLALSRAIISRQNGTISADNPPEGGARFTIRFYKSVI